MAEAFGLNHHDVEPGSTSDYWAGVVAVVAEQQQLLEAARADRIATDAPVMGGMAAAPGVEFTSAQY